MSERYQLVKPLGAGGMGEVFLARDAALDREVAVKTLQDAPPEQSSLFLREARVLGSLEHPNIVPVHDAGHDSAGRPFITMQYVRGETLASVIERLRAGEPATHRQFTLQRRLRIVQQLCEALDYAHSRQVLHRDIKPANVMLGSFGEVIVVDWGLSALQGQALSEEEAAGMTPAYAAPERISQDHCDVRSEVYSLGALAYELLALRPPFEGSLPELLTAVLQKQPTSPDELRVPGQSRVPVEVGYIVMRALSKNPEERQQSPLELAGDIQRFLEGEAPVVCVHTGFKRLVHAFARLLDNHGKLVIVTVAASATFLLVSYGYLLAAALGLKL